MKKQNRKYLLPLYGGLLLCGIYTFMNKKHRDKKKQQSKTQASKAESPIAIVTSNTTDEQPARKSSECTDTSQHLEHVSRWTRFKEWATTVTVAEFVTVLLTGGILVSTVYYTIYAKRQSSSLQRQIEGGEASQSGRLVIEDIAPTIIPGEFFNVEVRFKVKNVGPTVADDIAEGVGFPVINLEQTTFNPSNAKAPPQPRNNGPSLGPGEARPYTERSDNEQLTAIAEDMARFPFKDKNGQIVHIDPRPPSDKVLNGKMLYLIDVSVSYNDIFKRQPHITSDCVMYEFRTKTFIPCPNMHQHD